MVLPPILILSVDFIDGVGVGVLVRQAEGTCTKAGVGVRQAEGTCAPPRVIRRTSNVEGLSYF